MNNLHEKTIDELNELSILVSKEAQDLQSIINQKRALLTSIKYELQSRNRWSVDTVIDDMLTQLNTYKDEIDPNSFVMLERNLQSVLKNRNLYISKNSRHYLNGRLVANIYFDLDRLIISKILKYKLVKKNSYGVTPKFQIKFSFSNISEVIERKQVHNIFSTSKSKSYDFHIDNKEFLNINKQILSFIKNSYTDYNEIIPDMINVVKFIENELDSILLLHHLSQD